MRQGLMWGLSLPVLLVCHTVPAQWTLQKSHTQAGLRGVVNVGEGVAWASGSNGTVLHTTNGGNSWETCSVPPGASHLDFRAIQAWDARHALVMSSGPGVASRLFRTTDGCQSWTSVLTNSDPAGFWDDLRFADEHYGVILGDAVGGDFVLLVTTDGGATWKRKPDQTGADVAHRSVFAASNSSLEVLSSSELLFCTGGSGGPQVVTVSVGPYKGPVRAGEAPWASVAASEDLVDFSKAESSGCFSLATSTDGRGVSVAVGGDYKRPEVGEDSAWTTAGVVGGTFRFAPAKEMPHGYRSAVAPIQGGKRWIAVGPNGTDLSSDDGVTWHALAPGEGDTAGADKGWNALSLPFAVGPNGRIGRLRDEFLR